MIFNSVTYLLFLVAACSLYWLLPRTARLTMLFFASIAFYGFWRWEFVPLMLLSSITDYLVARAIHRSDRRGLRRALLMTSLTVNLGLLFVFKYLVFFVDNVWVGLAWLGVDSVPPVLNIILPLGISFYTFQTISYTVDVYRGFIKPEHNYILYSCYVMFFPQLVAGPILRAREVIPQLDRRPKFDVEDIATGLRRIIYGLFLKVVLADNISPFVDEGFALPFGSLGGLDVFTLAFLFGFQIYFDFSAYSHIAIGSARLMGIRFPENFNFPYLASSPREFWKRWHISLSSWIRDYLYLPLAGARVHDRSTGGLAEAVDQEQRKPKFIRALFLTWAIMGLWHGASWTMVVWGLWHASMIFIYRISAPLRDALPAMVRDSIGWLLTVGMAMLAWIPFRSQSLEHTLAMLGAVVDPASYFALGLRENAYIVAAVMLLLVVSAGLVRSRVLPILAEKPLLRLSAETAAITVSVGLVFVFLRPIQQFIYFQF